jgi:hypothetical protein
MQKFLETKKFFQKILENFQPPPTTERKKLKFPSRRRHRERHRLTPLVTVIEKKPPP